MFETAELGRELSPSEYEGELPELRTALLKAQTRLGHARFPVVVLIHGVDTVGANEVFNVLHEWLDARYLVSRAWEPPTDEERERPAYWRFWQWLSPRGEIALFLGSWYTAPLLAHATGKMKAAAFERELERAVAFEKALSDDGALFVKFWLHIPRRRHKERLRALTKEESLRYRVAKHVVKSSALHDELLQVSGRLITKTSVESAPWTVVEAADPRFRNITVGRELLRALEEHLAIHEANGDGKAREPVVAGESSDPHTVLDTLDLSQKLDPKEYKDRLSSAQRELVKLAYKLEKRERSAIVLFEGWDAAGKGGAIRRISAALDAHQYRIIPVAAPTEEERAHHYLWRFWRQLPRRGRFTIYDRSWYGRVLVERVEHLARDDEWRRGYREINDFEEQLVRGGGIVVKYWLHMSQDEQLRRFEARKSEPWKAYKLTDEDYRNRKKSPDYELAANEMIARTNTEYAPWTLVEAEDKRVARVKVLETLCRRIRDAL
ncbi:MAG TPA: polyphosphate:AMP phosphotransferase [Polyangiaceae bacterium]|nr:polyphosphate:AMP phosphotransferase [Polyangiaceae bacterium]